MTEAFTGQYDLVIGLEVHVRLSTESKLFASDPANFGDAPNENISVITLAHPGTLPKLNKKAIELAAKMGIACHCEVAERFVFDRKNYFYPDLPKGYQLTQDRIPICKGGEVLIRPTANTARRVRLRKIHLEEDAAKSIHTEDATNSYVDFNRAGVPLIEIVTEPDLYSPEEASKCLSEIRKLLRYMSVSDANMEEGSMRCDANVSVKPRGSKQLGRKVEIKNMNSFRNVSRAIQYEFQRQCERIERGQEVFSETRTFNAADGTTSPMRMKEELNDYRYFPDPDLSVVTLDDDTIQKLKDSIPPLPEECYQKLVGEYGLPHYDASFLTEEREWAEYTFALFRKTNHYKSAGNWLMGPVKSFLNENNISIRQLPISPSRLIEIIDLVEEKRVSHSAAARRIFPYSLKHPHTPAIDIARRLNLLQNSDEHDIKALVDLTLQEMPDKVTAYKKGKKGLFGWFMGEIMKKSKGKADPQVADRVLRESLASLIS